MTRAPLRWGRGPTRPALRAVTPPGGPPALPSHPRPRAAVRPSRNGFGVWGHSHGLYPPGGGPQPEGLHCLRPLPPPPPLPHPPRRRPRGPRPSHRLQRQPRRREEEEVGRRRCLPQIQQPQCQAPDGPEEDHGARCRPDRHRPGEWPSGWRGRARALRPAPRRAWGPGSGGIARGSGCQHQSTL